MVNYRLIAVGIQPLSVVSSLLCSIIQFVGHMMQIIILLLMFVLYI